MEDNCKEAVTKCWWRHTTGKYEYATAEEISRLGRCGWELSSVPNPGSEEALRHSCKCPVLDNHHGEGIPVFKEDGTQDGVAFWTSELCPIHRRRSNR